jgi:hypothetical protein
VLRHDRRRPTYQQKNRHAQGRDGCRQPRPVAAKTQRNVAHPIDRPQRNITTSYSRQGNTLSRNRQPRELIEIVTLRINFLIQNQNNFSLEIFGSIWRVQRNNF